MTPTAMAQRKPKKTTPPARPADFAEPTAPKKRSPAAVPPPPRSTSLSRIEPPQIPASSFSPPPPEPLPDAVRIGLCGIGRTGFGRIRTEIAASRQFRVQAGFDILPERAQQLREIFGATAHTSFDDLLADPSVELVIIATRSDTHAALAQRALAAGKHVVVEKPMATNLADADALIALANRSKGRLFVRHNRRFDPPFRCALETLQSGKLGRLHSVQIRVGEYVRRSDWQTLQKFGGGQLLNWGPHVIDWALQLIGGYAVEQWSNLKLVAAAGDAEDHVKLLLRGPDNTTGPATDCDSAGGGPDHVVSLRGSSAGGSVGSSAGGSAAGRSGGGGGGRGGSGGGGGGGPIADLEISGANACKQPPFVLCGDRGSLTIDGPRAKLRYLRTPPNRSSLLASDNTPGQDDRRYKLDDKTDWLEEDLPATSANPTDYWSEIYKTLRKNTPFPITLPQAREVMRVIEQCRVGTQF